MQLGAVFRYVPVTSRGALSLTRGARVPVIEGTAEWDGSETAIAGEAKIDPNWMLTRSFFFLKLGSNLHKGVEMPSRGALETIAQLFLSFLSQIRSSIEGEYGCEVNLDYYYVI